MIHCSAMKNAFTQYDNGAQNLGTRLSCVPNSGMLAPDICGSSV